MKNYIITLRKDFKTNEVAQGLAFVSFCFTVVFGAMVVATLLAGYEFHGIGNAGTFPILFAVLSIVHFLARPAVLNHYAVTSTKTGVR